MTSSLSSLASVIQHFPSSATNSNHLSPPPTLTCPLSSNPAMSRSTNTTRPSSLIRMTVDTLVPYHLPLTPEADSPSVPGFCSKGVSAPFPVPTRRGVRRVVRVVSAREVRGCVWLKSGISWVRAVVSHCASGDGVAKHTSGPFAVANLHGMQTSQKRGDEGYVWTHDSTRIMRSTRSFSLSS